MSSTPLAAHRLGSRKPAHAGPSLSSPRLRSSREIGRWDDSRAPWAARLADRYCCHDGTQAFCDGVLSDVAEDMNASSAWILLVDMHLGQIQPLARHGACDDEAWESAMSVSSRLISGGALLEQAQAGSGRCVAVPLRDGGTIFGVLSVNLEGPEPVGIGGDEPLTVIARLLSIYLRASLRSPRSPRSPRETPGKSVDPPTPQVGRTVGIVGRSPALSRVLERLSQIAPSEATVLIEGENGTGKELVARAIHRESARAGKPWIVVNCATLPENLLESELFGHERGAFTGAMEKRVGRFEQAHGGTVFLDEIGEMSLAMQVKLLRVLQEKTIQRLGGGRDIPIDVRFVAATNRNLAKMKEEGTFREDLYWRLYVVPVIVPPLRERRADIEPLVEHFVRKYAEETRVAPPVVDRAVLECFEAYDWPGNVRQLENLVHRLVLLCRNGEILEKDLPLELRGDDRVERVSKPDPFLDLLERVPATYDELQGRRRDLLRRASWCAKKLEDEFVDAILEKHSGNKTKAAQDTGMHRTLIHRNLRKRCLSS